MKNLTKQLLEQAKAIATEVLGNPSEETIRVVFLRLCDDHDLSVTGQAEPRRTVH